MAARKKKVRRKKAASRKKATRKKATRKATRPRARKATRSKPSSRGGPKPYEFDEDALTAVFFLGRAGNTIEDAAVLLGVSKKTFERRIADEESNVSEKWRLGKANRRDGLRTTQDQVALAGNASMLIWLGKQDLGQRDFKRLEVTGAGGAPLVPDSGGEHLELFLEKLIQLKRSRRKVDVDLPT